MSAAELLLELGVEEMPAGSIAPARTALAELMLETLQELRLAHGAPRTYATPRRLAISVTAVQTHQEDIVERKLGPARSVAFDPDGKPTKTAHGFCRGQGIDLAELRIFATERGEYVGFERTVKGKPASELLPEALSGIIARIPCRRSMRWGDRPERFVRPIRWMVCVHGGEVVPVIFGDVEAGNTTRGHRFLTTEAIPITGRADYLRSLRDAKVLADPEERTHAVVEGLRLAAKHSAGTDVRLLDDPELVAEVVNLIEWPVTVAGGIDERFIGLPREVLLASMRNHQRYFAMEYSDGSLAPHFLTVAGTEVRDLNVVRTGNERVLRARLADAEFFWEEDVKIPLSERSAELDSVTFAAQVGSYLDKQKRVSELAERMALDVVAKDFRDAEQVCADSHRAAELCKCDLVTGMVGEFPELQGVMGGHYARASGERENVAQAIAEHYQPDGEDDPLPQTRAGAALALADRLDSIAQLWAVGLRPTATKDRYAIRQQTIGFLRILFGRGLRLSLRTWIDVAVPRDLDQTRRDELVGEIRTYMLERVRALFERDIPADVVDAVLALGHDDPVELRERVRALDAMVREKTFQRFFDLAKRVRKIAPHERRVASEGGYEFPGLGEVDEKLLTHPTERALYEEYRAVENELWSHLETSDFVKALRVQERLIEPVDQFFNEGPKVLAEDGELQRNRTTLCAHLDRLMCRVADVTAVSSTPGLEVDE